MAEDFKPPQDEAQRNLARTNFEITLMVEAAAGTGKTSLLIDRIVNLVSVKHISLTRVAAITFTEKAAGELKLRLRDRLQKELTQEPSNLHYGTALREIESMSVGTIHGFCSDLIRQRPVEANIEPNFQVVDQQAAEVLTDQVWDEWIGEQLSQECPVILPFLEMELRLQSAFREMSLRKLFDCLKKEFDILDKIHVSVIEESEILNSIAAFQRKIQPKLAGLKTLCSDPKDKYLGELDKILIWAESFDIENINLQITLSWMESLPSVDNRLGSEKSWGGKETRKTVRSYRSELQTQIAGLFSLFFARLAKPMIEWLKSGVEKYQTSKADRQVLDFDDLLSAARDMLKDSSAARKYFKEKYDYLLVDEFQDTDPLQSEIIFYLAEKKDEFAERWEEVQLIPGKLFIVGDPKQSVYRFRRADLALYGKVKKLIESQNGRVIFITENFRSFPQIVEQVNNIFEPLMIGEVDGRYEPKYVKMIPHLESPLQEKRVLILESAVKIDEKQSVEDLAKLEAAHIAEFLLDSLPAGLEYKDCGILFRSGSKIQHLESALRAREIPYQLAGGKTFTKRAEFQMLKTVLAAIDNPYDQNSVVGALRSLFFAVDDEELLTHKLNRQEFNYLQATTDSSHLQNCFDLLKTLHQKKTHRNPSQIISELYERTEALALLALKPLGENRVANLLKVLDIARSMEQSQNISFHRFVKWLSELETLSTGEEEASVSEPTENTVNLMTFHKAKGLEFKLVILYDLKTDSDEIKDKVFIDRNTGIFEFSLAKSGDEETHGNKTAGFNDVLITERSRSKQENLRLLYVAMTRAKEYLILPKFLTEENDGFWSYLNSLPHSDCEVVNTENYALDAVTDEQLILSFEDGFSEDDVRVSVSEYEVWKSSLKTLLRNLNHEQEFSKPSQQSNTIFTETESSNTDNRNALTLGLAVHRVLEKINFSNPENINSVIRNAVGEYNLDVVNDFQEIKDLVQKFLHSELFSQRILKAEAIYRELEFTALIEDKLFEGKMDLVFIENGAPVVVDFKTDNVSKDSTKERVLKYASQGNIYRKALEQILKQPAHEVLIYFLRAEAIEKV